VTSDASAWQDHGRADFKDLFINLDPSKLAKDGGAINTLAKAKEAGAAVIAYGHSSRVHRLR